MIKKLIFRISFLVFSLALSINNAAEAGQLISKLIPKVRAEIARYDNDVVVIDQTTIVGGGGHNFFIQQEDIVLGSLAVIMFNNKATISNLYIKKSFRGQGHAKHLLDATVTRILSLGVTDIYLGAEPFELDESGDMVQLTGQTHKAALEKLVSLYQSCGFVETQRSDIFPLSMASGYVMKWTPTNQTENNLVHH